MSLDGGVFGQWVSFGQQVLFGQWALFRCRALFESLGAIWVSLGVVSVSYGSRWSVVGQSLGGWWLWSGVLAVMEPSYLFLLSNQDLISSYLIVHLIFHLISDHILSCLMMPSLLRTHGLHMYLI